jgi:di/tricarboxylate transporter
MLGFTTSDNVGFYHYRLMIGFTISVNVGFYYYRLMLGFMLPTWFLSMWISNTATTGMMLPISEAVLESLNETEENNNAEEDTTNTDEKHAGTIISIRHRIDVLSYNNCLKFSTLLAGYFLA